ncbi:hypothetical protein LL912_04080 [Niabella sp. CC-SYL272]|uniref:hypothetical protein n=1 Tax=Niabella agricola TaxID=2891571 RepID=UPI001F372BBE|nr:hypothetical protein [Niabella agricola]MCF3107949.1 hypothetical protein [Niabella agricola]
MNHLSHPLSGSGIQMHLLTAPETVTADKAILLSFKPVRRAGSGGPVTLVPQHEAAFHLIVLNEALTWFRHLHPVLQADGSYTVRVTFPAAGNYLLYADYQPEGALPVVDKIALQVSGNSQHLVAAGSEKLTATTGDFTISIDLSAPLYTGASLHLPFRIEREGKQLHAGALSPYLGAVAHLILIHRDDKDFLHIHPQAGTDVPVVAHTQFEKAGNYRIWIQFNVDGTVYTADFTLDVKDAVHGTPVQQHIHHHG